MVERTNRSVKLAKYLKCMYNFVWQSYMDIHNKNCSLYLVDMTTLPMCSLTSDQIDNLPDDDPDEAIDLLEAHELDDDLESVSDVRLKPLTKQVG